VKKLLQRKGIWILCGALSLSLIAAALTVLSGGRAGPLESVVQGVTRPFQTVATAVEQNVSHFYGQAAQHEQLLLENEQLRQKAADLEDAAREGRLATEENKRLRALLDFKERRQDLRFTPVKVQSESASNWSRSLTLNKGSDSGIEPRDCVVDANGQLVGMVSKVGDSFCSVYLITDAGFELGGEAVPSLERGVLCGDFARMNEGALKLSYLQRDTTLAPGDEIVSFSTEGLHPSGLLVGRVQSIERDPGGLYSNAILSPAADLSALHQLFVITDFTIQD